MERKYKKKSNLVNRTGYTPGYSSEKNPVNFIPSENITMANTPYPLQATPLDQNGNPIGNSVVMQPGEEYRFGGASYVAETPMFGHGGEKNDWISAKISKLVREGYPQKQAVAVAYEMYDNIHGDGGYQLPMYQDGKKDYNFGNTFAGSNFAKPKFSQDPNVASPEEFSASLNKITAISPTGNGLGADPNYVNPLSEESLTAGKDWAAKNPLPEGIQKPMPTNVFGAEVEDAKEKTTTTTGLEKPDIQGNQPFQFFNPYSGVDIPSASVMFGQSLENKDTLGAVASGAKVALGTARNILGGMGQARRENYVKKQYAEKQREGMTAQGRETMLSFGGYYQEGGMQPGMEEGLEGQLSNPQEEGMEQQGGGQEQQIMQEVAQMLQQGADPQQVIQQLVQMGIPQEQAVQMVQAVMQQAQGATPQMKRGGMMHYQDGGEQQMAEQVSQALQQGAQPQQVMQMLLKSGMPQDQAVQLVQAVMQQIQQQGHNSQEEGAEGGQPNPQEEQMEQGTPQMKRGGYMYQEGGMEQAAEPQQNEQMQAIMQQVSQMLQQGADPQQILQQLVEAGVPQEQAQQIVQAAMQQMQGGQQASQASPQMKRGGKYYQEGGEAMDEQREGENEGAEGETPSMEQIESQVEQALKQGADPKQVLEQLVQMGIPQEQAMQMIQEILQEIQGGETGMESPEQGTPQMKKGGEYLNTLKGKTIKDYAFNSTTGKYEVSYE